MRSRSPLRLVVLRSVEDVEEVSDRASCTTFVAVSCFVDDGLEGQNLYFPSEPWGMVLVDQRMIPLIGSSRMTSFCLDNLATLI